MITKELRQDGVSNQGEDQDQGGVDRVWGGSDEERGNKDSPLRMLHLD